MSAPDATPARLGPKVTIERDCFGCAFERSERYAVQSDSGCDVKCTHPSHGDGGKYIGDTTWRTPDWCPVTTDATPARGDVMDFEWLSEHIQRVEEGSADWSWEDLAIAGRVAAHASALTAERDALAARVRALEARVFAKVLDEEDALRFECEYLRQRVRALSDEGKLCSMIRSGMSEAGDEGYSRARGLIDDDRYIASLDAEAADVARKWLDHATPAPTGVHTQSDTEGGTDA